MLCVLLQDIRQLGCFCCMLLTAVWPRCCLQSSIPVRPASAAARLLQRITSGGSAAGAGGPQQHVDAAACALLDTAKTCTYRLTNTYGEVLMSVAAKQPPLVGTAAEAQALLASFLAHQE